MTRLGLRIDKWLWHARLVKTRSLAARLCAESQVLLGGVIVRKPATPTRIGDRITLTHAGWRRTVEVLDLGERRGPAAEAMQLYAETSEPVRLAGLDPAWVPLLGEDEAE